VSDVAGGFIATGRVVATVAGVVVTTMVVAGAAVVVTSAHDAGSWSQGPGRLNRRTSSRNSTASTSGGPRWLAHPRRLLLANTDRLKEWQRRQNENNTG